MVSKKSIKKAKKKIAKRVLRRVVKKKATKPIKRTIKKRAKKAVRKVLKKKVTNYMLRHSQGEHLHELVRQGKLSKENALLMMGHSEKMFDKAYSHPNKEVLKEVLKKQVLDIDYIAPEKKHKLELEIEELRASHEKANNKILEIADVLRFIKKLPKDKKMKCYEIIESKV